MLIGNRWIENARVKILNTSVIASTSWTVPNGSIITGLTEKGIIKGLSVGGGSNAATVVWIQVLFDDSCPHSGYFSAYLANNVAEVGNIQPAGSPMIEFDVPSSTTVRLRVRRTTGVDTTIYLDLWMVAYEVSEWEQALTPVCLVSDMPGARVRS